jgi:hypothetical protein
MNKLQKEWLAFRESAKIYLRYRRKPEEYADAWALEKKGEGYYDWFHNYRSRLLQFKNKYENEDCFIIGNGPSLNQMDLTVLKNYYTFGLSEPSGYRTKCGRI